jgi:hypothetical protein
VHHHIDERQTLTTSLGQLVRLSDSSIHVDSASYRRAPDLVRAVGVREQNPAILETIPELTIMLPHSGAFKVPLFMLWSSSSSPSV